MSNTLFIDDVFVVVWSVNGGEITSALFRYWRQSIGEFVIHMYCRQINESTASRSTALTIDKYD